MIARMRGKLAGAVALVFIAAAAACVGDDPSSGTPTGTPDGGGGPDATTPGSDAGGDAPASIDAGDAGLDATAPVPAAFSAVDVTDFGVPSGVNTRVPYKTELYDARDEYDPGTGRFVAATAGDYYACASLIFPAASYFELYLSKNGTLLGLALGAGPMSGCTTVRLAAGEYLEVLVRQGTGTLTVLSSPHWSSFTVYSVDARVALTNSAPATVTSGMSKRMPYADELFDVANEYDTGTSRFTAATAGDIRVCASAFMTSYAELCLESSAASANKCIASGQSGFQRACRVERMTTGATLDVVLWQYTGSDQSLNASAVYNWLNVSRAAARVALTAITPFTLPAAMNTLVPYVTESYDDKNEFDTGQSRFVASEGGDYEFCASLGEDGASFELHLYLNGQLHRGLAVGSNSIRGCRTLRLKTGDFVEVYARSAAEVSYDNTVAGWNWMTVTKMH
jgi:hypothetical protein